MHVHTHTHTHTFKVQPLHSSIVWLQIADYVIDPMCRGIFAGSARNLSMRSAFPAIHQYESNHGSIIRGALMTKTGITLPRLVVHTQFLIVAL